MPQRDLSPRRAETDGQIYFAARARRGVVEERVEIMSTAVLAQEVSEKPIIFGLESVDAILAGRKTQTRRVLKDRVLTQPPYFFDHISYDLGYPASLGHAWAGFRYEGQDADASALYLKCPYGKPGGRLWVREAWCDISGDDDKLAVVRSECEGLEREVFRWQSPIYMPRWAATLTLEITDVRVERLQDITAADCMAEGVIKDPLTVKHRQDIAIGRYAEAWDSLNAKRGFPFESNPWVWVIEFKPVGRSAEGETL